MKTYKVTYSSPYDGLDAPKRACIIEAYSPQDAKNHFLIVEPNAERIWVQEQPSATYETECRPIDYVI